MISLVIMFLLRLDIRKKMKVSINFKKKKAVPFQVKPNDTVGYLREQVASKSLGCAMTAKYFHPNSSILVMQASLTYPSIALS